MLTRHRQHGFTLVELIMVIVLMGVIGGILSVFMRGPIDAYFSSGRRAALTDVADTTVRRMARDLRKALPNSIRAPTTQCIEFIPTRIGGRYRYKDIVPVPSDGTGLRFDAVDLSFNMLGLNTALPADQQIRANDIVAFSNWEPGTDSDAYAGNNSAVVTGVVTPSPASADETQINLAGNTTVFPLESPGKRFHVIPGDERVVSFICAGGVLYRNFGYALGTSCPAPVVGTTPVMATGATCNFTFNADNIRNALVQLTLTFTNTDEAVTIYHEVHVDNTP